MPIVAPLLVQRLARFPAALAALVEGLSEGETDWHPTPTAWSIRDVVLHLAAEEVEDFRPRLASTLADPRAPWMPLDPVGSVRRARDAGRSLAEALASLREERARSVAWISDLGDDTWSTVHEEPPHPPQSAGSLLASWAAHDARHLGQVARLLHALAARDAGPHDVGYAG